MKKNGTGKDTFWTAILIIFLIGILIAAVWGVVYATKSALTLNTKANDLKALWEDGNSVQGIAYITQTKRANNDIELRYTVGGKEYKTLCSVDNINKYFGDDVKAGQEYEVEIHYDANDPQNAVIEAAVKYASTIANVATILFQIMALVLFVEVLKVIFRKRLLKRKHLQP